MYVCYTGFCFVFTDYYTRLCSNWKIHLEQDVPTLNPYGFLEILRIYFKFFQGVHFRSSTLNQTLWSLGRQKTLAYPQANPSLKPTENQPGKWWFDFTIGFDRLFNISLKLLAEAAVPLRCKVCAKCFFKVSGQKDQTLPFSSKQTEKERHQKYLISCVVISKINYCYVTYFLESILFLSFKKEFN